MWGRRTRRVAQALLLLACWISQAQWVHAEPEGTAAAAQAHFNAGVEAMQQKPPDYLVAYREFKAAYGASQNWKILGNLAIVAMKLERDGEAIEAINRFLLDGGPALDPAEREQFEQDLSVLQRNVSWVTLKGIEGAKIVDRRVPAVGSTVENEYVGHKSVVRLGLRAGEHEIVATNADGIESKWDVLLKAGASRSFTFAFDEREPAVPETLPVSAEEPASGSAGPADAEPGRPITTGIWIAAGATAALAVGGAVTGVLTLGVKSDFDKANDGLHREEAKDLQGDLRTHSLVTDVLFGAAAVSAGVTAYLYLTRPEQPVAAQSVTVSPVASPHSVGLSLSGKF